MVDQISKKTFNSIMLKDHHCHFTVTSLGFDDRQVIVKKKKSLSGVVTVDATSSSPHSLAQ